MQILRYSKPRRSALHSHICNYIADTHKKQAENKENRPVFLACLHRTAQNGCKNYFVLNRCVMSTVICSRLCGTKNGGKRPPCVGRQVLRADMVIDPYGVIPRGEATKDLLLKMGILRMRSILRMTVLSVSFRGGRSPTRESYRADCHNQSADWFRNDTNLMTLLCKGAFYKRKPGPQAGPVPLLRYIICRSRRSGTSA